MLSSLGVAVLLGLLASATAQSSVPCSKSFIVAEGAYNASWKVEGDDIIFTVRARTTGWVGIGFSRDQRMANSDIVVGGVFQGTTFAYDGYAIQQARPPKDPQQDITDVTVTQAGGVTTLQFTRKRVTGDTNDLALDSPFYLLFAWNGPVTGVEVIGYHGAATRAVSFETVTIPTAQQCTTTTIGHSGNATFDGQNVTFTWESTGATGLTYKCSLNNGSWFNCTPPIEVPCDQLLPGMNMLEVIACFSDGRPAGSLQIKITVICKSTTTITHNGTAEVVGENVVFTWESTGATGLTYKCSLNGDTQFDCTSPYSVACASLREGENVFTVSAFLSDGRSAGSIQIKVTKPPPCSGSFSISGGAYNATWKVEGDDIIFTVTAQTTGWVGIGFSQDQKMPNSDTVVGGVFQGTAFAYDGYATAYAQPPKDAQQDIRDVTVTQAGGVTTLRFTRKRVTGDTNDLALDSPFYLLFAWNGPVSGVEMISYHGAATRAANPQTVTLPTAQQCPPPPSGTFTVSGGAYNATWKVEGDGIIFTVTARTTGWVGIGFSQDQKMPNSDTVVGGVFQGTAFAYDGYATTYAQPSKDAQQDITDVTVTQAGGVTTLRFTRKRVTGDTNDLALDSPFHFLFAWNGVVTGVEMIGYHGAATRIASDLFTFPTAPATPSPTTSTPTPTPGTPTLPPACVNANISTLDRDYLWPSGFVRFKWTSNMTSTRCKLDGGQEMDCESGVQYFLGNITAGKHSIEVVAYCRGVQVRTEQKNFRSQSGIPSDPNCQRMSIQNSTAVYDAAAETVSITFDTSTASTCVCKVPAIGQRKRNCESGHVFTGAMKSLFGKKKRSKVAVICKSADCSVKHMVPVYFDLR